MRGLAILRVRSPLLTESLNCFLLLRVLRCFTSPRSLPPAIHSPAGNTTSLVLGYPIRTSSDPRSVDNSPRHIAASHVLHRLPMPRHPPCALKHLHTTKKHIKPANPTRGPLIHKMLATTIHNSNTTPHHQARRQHTQGVLPQDPTVCLAARAPALDPRHRHPFVVHPPPPDAGAISQCSLERR